MNVRDPMDPMDPAEDPIADALYKLRPAALESPLMVRLTAARPRGAELRERVSWREVLLRWLMPAATGACAAVVVFAILENRRMRDVQNPVERRGALVGEGAMSAGVEAGDLLPVESADYLLSVRPMGIMVAPDHRPYRIMDVEWIEHETVRMCADGTEFHTATVRRDVIPVALELY